MSKYYINDDIGRSLRARDEIIEKAQANNDPLFAKWTRLVDSKIFRTLGDTSYDYFISMLLSRDRLNDPRFIYDSIDKLCTWFQDRGFYVVWVLECPPSENFYNSWNPHVHLYVASKPSNTQMVDKALRPIKEFSIVELKSFWWIDLHGNVADVESSAPSKLCDVSSPVDSIQRVARYMGKAICVPEQTRLIEQWGLKGIERPYLFGVSSELQGLLDEDHWSPPQPSSLNSIQLDSEMKFISNSIKKWATKDHSIFQGLYKDIKNRFYVPFAARIEAFLPKPKRERTAGLLGVKRLIIHRDLEASFLFSIFGILKGASYGGMNRTTLYEEIGEQAIEGAVIDIDISSLIPSKFITDQFERRKLAINIGSILFDSITPLLSDFVKVNADQDWLSVDWIGAQSDDFSFNFGKVMTKAGLLFDHQPMVVPPRQWANEVDLDPTHNYSGGYLMNGKGFNISLVKRNDLHKTKIIDQRYITAINYLQSSPFRINLDLFDLINTEPFASKLLISKKDYLDAKNELIKLGRFGVDRPLSTSLTVNSLREKIDKYAEQQRTLALAAKFTPYKNFHFVYRFDFRGRMIGLSALNPMNGPLARSLLQNANKDRFDFEWFKICAVRAYLTVDRNHINSFDKQISYFDYGYAGQRPLSDLMKEFRSTPEVVTQADEPFVMLSLCLEYERFLKHDEKNGPYRSHLLVAVDVSSSGPQILTLCSKYGEYVDALNLRVNARSEPMGDYYVRVLKEFREYYTSSTFKATKLGESWDERNFDSFFKREYLARKLFKQTIMCIPYGLSRRGKDEYLFEAVQLLRKEKENTKLIEEHFGTTNDSIFKSVILVVNVFEEFGKKSVYLRFMKHIQDAAGLLAKHKNEFVLDGPTKVSQQYRKSYVKRIQLANYSDYKIDESKVPVKKLPRKEVSIRLIDKSKFDVQKNTRSIVANFIQWTDGLINVSLLSRFANQGVLTTVGAIHDCWYLPVGFIPTLQYHFMDSMINIFVEEDLFSKFLLYTIMAFEILVANKSDHDTCKTIRAMELNLACLQGSAKKAEELLRAGGVENFVQIFQDHVDRFIDVENAMNPFLFSKFDENGRPYITYAVYP